MISWKKIALPVIAILILAFGAAYGHSFITSSASQYQEASRPENERIVRMKDLIKKLGPEEAYKVVLDWSAQENERDPHRFGHDFGYAAFQLNVDPARILTTCKTELLFGCLHEFIGQSLFVNGVDYVRELELLCLNEQGLKLYLSCVHGLGHGLVAYAGYDESTTFEVIRYCDDIFLGDHNMGCHGGIFMEYNDRSFINESPRVFNSNDPYDPCTEKGKYTGSCLFWLPLWWSSLDPNVDPEIYMNRCTNFPGTREEKASCYEGVGRIMVATSVEEFANTAARCDRLGQAADDAWLACRWSALRDYNDIPLVVDQDPQSRCIGLVGKPFAQCEEYMQQRIDEFNHMSAQLMEEQKKAKAQ